RGWNEVSEQVELEVTMEVEDDRIIFKWNTEKLKKTLDYDAARCTGCGLCVLVCPCEAIQLGPIPEIAMREVEAPKVVVDQNKCSYCGLCSAVCLTKAMKLKMGDKYIQESADYPQFVKDIEIDKEKCKPCLICEHACPNKSITADLKIPKKEELVIYEGEKPKKIEGEIIIDKDKCTYCGLCAMLCNAIEIGWRDVTPNNPSPGSSIRVVEEECDYCGLCQKICPYDAIKVNCKTDVKREIKELKWSGDIKIDREKCLTCGLCKSVCPQKAISVTKAFEGEIRLHHPEKCDPVGCKACMNICPSKVWFIPETIEEKEKFDKIAFNPEFCSFCGACEKSCPEKIIEVVRKNVRYTKPNDTPWSRMWVQTFLKLIGKDKKIPKTRIVKIQREEEKEPTIPEEKIPEITADVKKKLSELIKKARAILKEKKTRMLTEKGETEKVIGYVKKELGATL
ncbi:MAG: 4Fe-4S binding protein, partial [Candidatus Jordarchaeaceae archaeon]